MKRDHNVKSLYSGQFTHGFYSTETRLTFSTVESFFDSIQFVYLRGPLNPERQIGNFVLEAQLRWPPALECCFRVRWADRLCSQVSNISRSQSAGSGASRVCVPKLELKPELEK